MPAAAEPHPVGRSTSSLGPHVVGTRVVVRRLVPGETGPTGGPAFTDVLGVLEQWDASPGGLAVLRREDGSTVSFDTALVVSGKPVPPRPSRFSRLSPDAVLRLAQGGYRRLESRPLGEWELRYVGGANPRANSVLAAGDPGLPLDAALAEVSAWYAARGRAAGALVVADTGLEVRLRERGWTVVGTDTDVLVAGVAAVSRALAGVDTSSVLHPPLTRGWLVGNDRAQAGFEVVAATLDLPDIVFAAVEEDGRQLGRVRVNLVGDWACVADLFVAPDARGRGLARVLLADATRWAGEQGASALVLDADSVNDPAQALYAGLGFERHHAFRLLQEPEA